MAFTIAAIEKAIQTPRVEWPRYYAQLPELNKSVNYPIITDYLTGKSNSLAGLQQDDFVHYWSTLVSLLTSLENISPDEQLVLDIIHHPFLSSSLHHSFLSWLQAYTYKTPTDNAFSAVVAQFNKMGLNDDAIFIYFVFGTHNFSSWSNEALPQPIKDSPLKKFLLHHIGSWTSLAKNMPQHNYWRGDSWSLKFFYLLEEANPAFAQEYALSIIYADSHHIIEFLLTYKNGSYLPSIIASLTNKQNFNLETIQSKFGTAIQFYEADPVKYTGLAITLAQHYLDHVAVHLPKQTWERNFHLDAFKDTVFSYLPYSSCAFYLLLQRDKSTGLQKINEWVAQKIFIPVATLQVLHHHIGNEAFPYIERSLTTDAVKAGIDYYRLVINFLQQYFEPEKYLPLLWPLANNKSKPLRQLVAAIVAEKDSAAETKAIALLENKSADARQTGAMILSYFSTPSSREAMMKVLNSEASDNARDLLLQTVADSLPAQASMDFIETMVLAAKNRGKLTKPIEPLQEEAALPSLFYLTGKELTADEIRFLLYRMSRVKEMRSDTEARYILQMLDKDKSHEFALAIIKGFIEKGAKPEHKWMMALAALLGNDTVVDKLRITINKWMEENRGKMAEYGVGALALQGSDKALRWVEWYSRKYKSKKANVGVAALMALETAADELGITIHELGDKVVPDFGFDGLFKTFEAAGEPYRAFIDSNFKMAYFNEDNKKLKAIPAATDPAIKEEFKAIAKEVRDIVKSQSSRLEYYLIIQRKWTYAQWQQFFLQNPVMFIYATKLIWGVFDAAGQLQHTFMCSEDTSLLNAASEEISLEENALIGIVHPTQLDAAEIKQWQQLFYDLSVESVFPQLDRKMPDMTGIDLSKPIIRLFEGKQMQVGSTRSTLEKFGWHKGPTGDGGMLESFNLLYFEKKIEAVLEVEGIGAGYGWGGDEKLGRLYVIDKTKVINKWGVYIKNEEDENLVKLDTIPQIFLSEMLAAVQAIKPFEKKG